MAVRCEANTVEMMGIGEAEATARWEEVIDETEGAREAAAVVKRLGKAEGTSSEYRTTESGHGVFAVRVGSNTGEAQTAPWS